MAVVIRVTSGPHSGQEYLIDRRQAFMVGRSSRVHFPMTKDLLLSREHFRIENQPPLCHLADMGSTNGTKVNGHRVERVLLRDGDIITAGDSSFVVQFAGSSGDGDCLTTCAGCGKRIPIEEAANRPPSPASDRPSEEGSYPWLCLDCQARRLKYPKSHSDYLIEEWIGGGGMGEVFRARQLSKNRPVAIKMMSANSTVGEKANGYFRREIEVLRDLLMSGGQSHPSIVAFYEIYEIDSQFQLVMEYVDGKNALEWTRALKDPMPFASAAQIGRHLLSALDYAHSKGYVHRDVKPSNLLVMGPAHPPPRQAHGFRTGQELRRVRGLHHADAPGRRRRLDRLHLARSHPGFPRGPGARRYLQRRGHIVLSADQPLSLPELRSPSARIVRNHPATSTRAAASVPAGCPGRIGAGPAQGHAEAAARSLEIGPDDGGRPPSVPVRERRPDR